LIIYGFGPAMSRADDVSADALGVPAMTGAVLAVVTGDGPGVAEAVPVPEAGAVIAGSCVAKAVGLGDAGAALAVAAGPVPAAVG
jgi:hypothetical protein